jgi:CheY-like chemotaxis protein
VVPRPTRVADVIERAIVALEAAAAAKHIALVVDVDRNIGPLMMDPERVHQVVWHLVANAIKFTSLDGRVDVRLTRGASEIILVVSDTGIGLTADEARHMFDHFRQGDSSVTRRFSGLGLGLGIVRHLVELHGGGITAHSAGPGHGATFEVRLPTRAADQWMPDIIPPSEHEPLLRGVSVLAVDTSAQGLQFLRSTLEHHGAVVRTASTLDEATERFERDPPDVFISEVSIPDEDAGLRLIREVRRIDAARGMHTPAIALTVMARTDDRRRALEAGYQMHMTKPFDPVELAAAVQRLTGT